jgi:hypothetical protein
MGQQQAQINNSIIPDSFLQHPQMKKKNLHTVATKRPLALNGRSKESKHNLEAPVEAELSNHYAWTVASKRLPSYHYSHRQRSFFPKQGRKGKSHGTWDNGKRVTTWLNG